MEVYKIRRISDGFYYIGKSRFTKHGTYFRKQQIVANMPWVKSLEVNIELVSYGIEESDSIVVDWDLSYDDLIEILNRDEELKKLLK